MSSIRRDFLPEDLAPRLSANGFDGCVAVQAQQTVSETEWLLSLAHANDFVRGVVGWLDLCSDKLGAQLDHVQGDKKFVGVRHIVQAESAGFMGRPDFRRGLALLAEREIPYDLLVRSHQLTEAIELVDALPNLRIVLDHLGKPNVAEGELETWSEPFSELSLRPNVWIKLSGLVTEADWPRWHHADFSFYLDKALETFGVGRLMFGSDWPVCLVAAHYSDVVSLVEDWLSESEHAAVFGDTAAAFYELG